MYERLKRLYLEGRIDTKGLQNAVRRGWILDEEMEDILKEKNDSDVH